MGKTIRLTTIVVAAAVFAVGQAQALDLTTDEYLRGDEEVLAYGTPL